MEPADNSHCIYVIDSSGWISIETHPDHNRILYRILELIESGRVQCPPEVWEELQRCDWVHAWTSVERPKIIRSETDAIYLQTLGRVFAQFPGMCGTRGSKEKADGYVVALAAYGNAISNPHRWVVVAAETLASHANRKIPRACEHYGIECIGFLAMLQREFPDDRW